MKFCVLYQQTADNAHCPIRVVEQTTGRDVGWINRYLQLHPRLGRAPFRAVALTGQTPRSFEGPAPTIAMAGLNDFMVRTRGADILRFETLYREGTADLIHATGTETFEALKILQAANARQYAPANGAIYPGSPLGRSLHRSRS